MRTRDLSQRTKKKGVTKGNMCLIYHKTPANQTFANIWKKKNKENVSYLRAYLLSKAYRSICASFKTSSTAHSKLPFCVFFIHIGQLKRMKARAVCGTGIHNSVCTLTTNQ